MLARTLVLLPISSGSHINIKTGVGTSAGDNNDDDDTQSKANVLY